MDSFLLSQDCVLSVIHGLVADQLNRADQSNRTRIAGTDWSRDVKLGPEGIGLDEPFIAMCAEAVIEFFGVQSDLPV